MYISFYSLKLSDCRFKEALLNKFLPSKHSYKTWPKHIILISTVAYSIGCWGLESYKPWPNANITKKILVIRSSWSITCSELLQTLSKCKLYKENLGTDREKYYAVFANFNSSLPIGDQACCSLLISTVRKFS